MISESAMTQLSLMISESTRAMSVDKSMRQLWKQFLLTISESIVTQFSLMISESTAVVCADKSMHFVKPNKKFSLWADQY
jgi:hypothetical protein